MANRMMQIEVKGEDGTVKKINFRFYRRTIFSSQLLTTGDPIGGIIWFDGSSDEVRNYTMRQNFFDTGRGRICGARAKYNAASMSRLIYTEAELAAIVLVSSQMSVNMLLDTDTFENPMITELMPAYEQTALVVQAAIAINEIGPLSQKGATKVGIYWDPPIWVDLGKSTSYQSQAPRDVPAAVTIPAALNNYLLTMILALEELPGGNPVQART